MLTRLAVIPTMLLAVVPTDGDDDDDDDDGDGDETSLWDHYQVR